MPYPIENNLYIRGGCDDLAAFLEFCGEGFDFRKFIPCPQVSEDRDWCLEHWGTSLNAFLVKMPEPPGADEGPDPREILVFFETALGPPLPVVAEASRRFPGLDFDLRYIGDGFPGNGIYHCRGGGVISAVEIELMQALSTVMEYLWRDELEDYRADPQPGHIFEDLVILDGWLSRREKAARDYLNDEEEGEGKGLEAAGFAFRGSRRPPGEPGQGPRQLSKVVDDVIGKSSTPHAPRCGHPRPKLAVSIDKFKNSGVCNPSAQPTDNRRNRQ